MDLRRHAPIGRPRARLRQTRGQQLPQVFLGRRRQSVRDVYLGDNTDGRREGRFRWLFSTILAGAVGVLAIGVVITGSLERGKNGDGLLQNLPALSREALRPFQFPRRIVDGLKWAVPKTGRLRIAAGVTSTKHIIHESMRLRRGTREMIQIKPYLRMTSKLAAVPAADAPAVPPFNPLKLYSAAAAPEDHDGAPGTGGAVSVKFVELLGGIVPIEDGQELDDKEVASLVTRVQREAGLHLIRASFNPAGGEFPGTEPQASPDANAPDAPLPPYTSILTKNRFEAEAPRDDRAADEVKVITVKRGDRLINLIARAGAEPWQAAELSRAAAKIFPAEALSAGQEIYFTLRPSLTRADKLELVRFSIFATGHRHKVTVARDGTGEFVASTNPIDTGIARAIMSGKLTQGKSTLYAGFYHAALQQDISEDVILRILRIHAYDTDFRARLRAGNSAAFFFDVKEDGKGGDGAQGELLFTALTAGAKTNRFYRFRTSDGKVDYFDARGNNSKKFLTRKPVRSEQVRLTSGYGMRRHPLHNIRKMHHGVDWAAPRGTPILAAGNGIVEKAGRKGGYGKYVRIRHANGYKTAYGHMHRIARGIAPGTKVRQGQLIGLVGSTGFSSGPHLHFEVLVNNRQIDPMRMQVPRQRRLTGKDLADYQRERARIDDLMRRAPVTRPGR